jgi:signal transduction histidine kinase
VVLNHTRPRSLLIDLSLCAALAAWMLVWITWQQVWRGRARLMAIFMAGLIVLMGVLILRDSWFGFFCAAGYLFAFRVIWPWRLASVGAVAVVAGTAQASGVTGSTALRVVVYVAVIVANALPMCGLAWLSWRDDNHSDQREQAFDEVNAANRRLEATLAENAALHEQLLTQARQAGVQDERHRMAQEIHDTLAQGLTGIITQLQAAEQASADPIRWRRHVTVAIGLARESLSEARRSVDALRPKPLETARLSEALAEVAARWSALHGIAVQVTTTGTVRPMAPQAEVALLRTEQEALANIAKHARATRVGVTLSYLEDEVALDVRDDGCGFRSAQTDDVVRAAVRSTSPDNVGSGGFGLVAMRQRIEGLAGTVQIESEPGAGTAISVRVPVTVS